jgi:hypothetical protein
MYGELAWNHWASGKKRRASAALCALVFGLVTDNDPGNPRFREVYNKTGHALGWYVTNGAVEQFPLEGSGAYRPVEAGFFAIGRKMMQKHIPTNGFSMSSILGVTLKLAASKNLLGIAWKAYEVALTVEEGETSNVLLTYLAARELPPLAVRLGHVNDGLAAGLRAVKVQVAYKRLLQRAPLSGRCAQTATDFDGEWR